MTDNIEPTETEPTETESKEATEAVAEESPAEESPAEESPAEESPAETGAEAEADVEEQAPLLVERRVLGGAVRAALREEYGDACQVCGRVVRLGAEQTYAEVHALVPAGGVEPEEAFRNACIVLCPEHHAMFDAGVLAIHPDEEVLYCADPRDPLDGSQLHCRTHSISREVMREAWAARVEPPEDLRGAGGGQPTPESLVEALLVAACEENEEFGFEGYVALLLERDTLSVSSRETHRRFAWAQLRRRIDSYLDDRENPRSFHIHALQPSPVTKDTKNVRVMLQAKGRNPAPLAIARGDDGYWWLTFCGL